MIVSSWRSVALAVLAVAGLVGAGAGACGSAEPTASPTPATPSATPTAAAAPQGTWRSEPFGREAIAAMLNAAGLGQHTEAFFAAEKPDSLVMTLRIEADRWTLYRADSGGPEEVSDRGTYTVDGDTLLYRPNSGGLNTYRWAVVENRLTLTFVSTTEPNYGSIPNEVFQRAFYTTAVFHRVP